jgi:hypothetical protein
VGEDMGSEKKTERWFVDSKIDVKTKLAALQVILMFFYMYADILSFYKPGIIE